MLVTMCRPLLMRPLIALCMLSILTPALSGEGKLRFELLNVTIANPQAQLGAVSHLQESPDHLQLPVELIMEGTLEQGT